MHSGTLLRRLFDQINRSNLNTWKKFGVPNRNMSKRTGKHKIGVVQLTCKADKDENFEIAKNLIQDAKNKGALVSTSVVLIGASPLISVFNPI